MRPDQAWGSLIGSLLWEEVGLRPDQAWGSSFDFHMQNEVSLRSNRALVSTFNFLLRNVVGGRPDNTWCSLLNFLLQNGLFEYQDGAVGLDFWVVCLVSLRWMILSPYSMLSVAESTSLMSTGKSTIICFLELFG